jgi:hypothetical protein
VTANNPSSYGKNTGSFTFAFPITSQGTKLPAESTAVYFIKGRMIENIGFTSILGPFPAAIANHLTSVAEERLR